MNPEEIRFRFYSRSKKKKRNNIRIGGVVLNCFEYENEKVKEIYIYIYILERY